MYVHLYEHVSGSQRSMLDVFLNCFLSYIFRKFKILIFCYLLPMCVWGGKLGIAHVYITSPKAEVLGDFELLIVVTRNWI